MHCPDCQHKSHLELDLHSDGYSQILLECSECGALLTAKGRTLEAIQGRAIRLGASAATRR